MKANYLGRFAIGFLILLLAACSSGGSSGVAPVDDTSVGTPETSAAVFRQAAFGVTATYDVIYAEGQSHIGWNAPGAVTQDLLLDVYQPMNDEVDRPAMVFIHGGGFIGGDKAQGAPAAFARYFAERGFVGVSINYRLLGDYGTLPASFSDAVDAIPLLTIEERDQIKAMYPATRDAKAALRWLAANAETYGLDPDMISVVGGSAGSYISLALGASDLDDYTAELSLDEDPTLATTNLDDEVIVAAVVDHWGGTATVDLLEIVDGTRRWDLSDAPLSIVHGTEDLTVPYTEAEALVNIYTDTGAYFELITLEGAGHGAWNTMYNGQRLEPLAFDFVTRMLGIDVQEN
ncbi:MAG: alpha/beta hydrolase [Pseudomonadota bacterium]